MTKEEKEEYFDSAKLFSPTFFMIDDAEYFTAFWTTIFGGTRLVSGYVGSMFYELDICCGSDYNDVLILRTVYEKVIGKNIKNNKSPIYGLLSCSDPKPYPKDPKFMNVFQDLIRQLAVDELVAK